MERASHDLWQKLSIISFFGKPCLIITINRQRSMLPRGYVVFITYLGKLLFQLKDVLVVVELKFPEGDQGEEEDWEKGEEGVRHTLAPHRTELSIL